MGDRKFLPTLARAAVAVGVSSVFMETHDNPAVAPSDGPNIVKLEDLQNIAIGSRDGNPVLLKDVATISRIPSSSNSISRTNGNPSVGVSVFKDPEANTVDVTQAVLNSANSQAEKSGLDTVVIYNACLLYTSPSPRD